MIMTSNSLIVFATVLLVSSFAVCLITAVDPSEEEARLSQGACALQSDPALEDQYEAFYKSVRIRYGSDECDPERNFTDPAVCTGGKLVTYDMIWVARCFCSLLH